MSEAPAASGERQAAVAAADVERQQAAATQPRAASLPQNPYELLLDGKRFVCTECGKCCQGSGEVWANEAECAALARQLNMSLPHFLSRYTKSYSRKPGWRMLKNQANGDCVFLRDGKQCTVYGARPLQCSTYPWWPELMDDASWVAEGRAVCEGIEHEDAVPVDPGEKAAVLQAATDYFAEQAAAAEEGRRAGKKRRGGA